MTRRLVPICLAAIAALAAGCGGGGGGSSGAPAASAPATSGSGDVVTVDMKNIQFNPKTVTVSKGATVEWKNSDSVNHDVTKDSGPGQDFKSGTGDIGSGGTYEVSFDQAGTVEYECTVHPGMTGTVVVK